MQTRFLKLAAIILLCTFFSQIAYSQKGNDAIKVDETSKDSSANKLDGLYSGIEKISGTIDPSKPKWKWYHLTNLKIKGDSVFLEQAPIRIYKKDTSYSASDGGFYKYSGTLVESNKVIEIDLTETSCDNCGEPMEKNADGKWVRVYRTKKYIGKLTGNGILINGYLFSKEK